MNRVKFGIVFLLAFLSAGLAFAEQSFQTGVTYVCNGERMVIESCNMQNLSDNASCMVAHPDRPLHNGFMAYTNETRGALNKLAPTCKPPSANEVARAQAMQKKQEDTYNANVQKANNQLNAATQPVTQPANYGQPQKPRTPEERALNRCITSGRLPASCTGNSLLGAFSQMISQVLPAAAKEPPAGPNMAGVFQGAGNWRLDFIDNGVLVNCSFLSPDQHSYVIKFENNRTAIIIDTTPKALVLTLKADGTMVGPGPLQIDGVVASGYTSGDGGNPYSGGYHDQYGGSITNAAAASGAGPVYDSGGNRVYGAVNAGNSGHTTFASKTATCPALNLSSKGAGVGLQTMQTDLLKTMFGGDKGPPTPPGIRMHGIFAAATGFSVQFFPESAILGCGPDAARAYPYTVVADGTKAVIQIAAADHPLTLAFRPDGALDPGASGPYQVHGRIVTGQNDNDDFTFAPLEQSCNLAVLTPSGTIPSGGGSVGTTVAAASSSMAKPTGLVAATPSAPTGNAVLSVASALSVQAGTANPLAGHTLVLMKDSLEVALAKGGFQVPPGTAPFKAMLIACASHAPNCPTATAAINADTAAGVRIDPAGKASFPGVPPGSYYVMGSAVPGGHPVVWDFKVDLKAGANAVSLDQRNATPLN